MKIIIDSAIPFVEGVFDPFCSVIRSEGSNFHQCNVESASALLVRTRTRCNRELLQNSSVRHIATATIGFDHIDTAYCSSQGIEVSTAAGCNARAVLQWIAALLVHLSTTEGWMPHQRTVGVVGVGNVGSLVSRYCAAWGFRVICCDPPRAEREGGDFVSLEDLLREADIVTFHTPLNESTHHMLNSESVKIARPETFFINSSRGEVIDTEALLAAGNPFAMDVWEDEPQINPCALSRAAIATPHIAGYSLQGKANASTIAVHNIASALKLPLESWCSDVPYVEPRDIGWEELRGSIGKYFDIEQLSEELKTNPELFEQMRNNYNYREEYF